MGDGIGGASRGFTALGSVGSGVIPFAPALLATGAVLGEFASDEEGLVLNPFAGSEPWAPEGILWGRMSKSFREDFEADLIRGTFDLSVLGNDAAPTEGRAVARNQAAARDWRVADFEGRGYAYQLQRLGGSSLVSNELLAGQWSFRQAGKRWYQRETLTETQWQNLLAELTAELENPPARLRFTYLRDHDQGFKAWGRARWMDLVASGEVRQAFPEWWDANKGGLRQKHSKQLERRREAFEVEADAWAVHEEKLREEALLRAQEAALEEEARRLARAVASGQLTREAAQAELVAAAASLAQPAAAVTGSGPAGSTSSSSSSSRSLPLLPIVLGGLLAWLAVR